VQIMDAMSKMLEKQGRAVAQILVAVTTPPGEEGETRLEKALTALLTQGTEHTAKLGEILALLKARHE
jgi:hypothetical protein